MRTKTLICAAALAAGALTSWAQSNVYSLNVVGYVNRSFLNQNFIFVANPLMNGGNYLSNLFNNATTPDNTTVYTWNDAAQKFNAELTGNLPTFSSGLGKWTPEEQIPPGRG